MTDVNIDKIQLAKYLSIASNQRKRAVNKFIQDYGPSSATVLEVSTEVAQLDLAITQLMATKK